MNIPENISQIAAIIRKDWKNVYYGAVPYLDAMHSIQTIDDTYGSDNARGIINYFLNNASTWRGEVARAVKAKLKALIK